MGSVRFGGRTSTGTVTRKGKTREGAVWNTAHVYRVLANRMYLGEVTHKGQSYPGEHEAIIDQGAWDKVHAILDRNAPIKQAAPRAKLVAPLKGVILQLTTLDPDIVLSILNGKVPDGLSLAKLTQY